MFDPRSLGARTIAAIVGVVLILVLGTLLLGQCEKRRSQAAQSKVDHAQTGAFQNSASDAVNTGATVAANETASETMTRSNERTIRDAKGAADKVNPAVRDAGFASLCKRASFRNSPTGRLRCPAAPGVAKGR